MATTRTKPARKAAPATDPAPVKDPAPIVAPPDQPIPARPAPRPKDAPRTMRELRLAREGKRASRAKPVENVLRDGLRLERVPDPSIVVLFGATGDLAHRKVIPALYHLWRTNLLPHEFMLVAIGRRPYTDESFRAEIRASLEQFSRVLPIDVEAWETFEQRIDYKRLDFDDDDGFDLLAKYLDDHDAEHGTRGNRLFYLATQPSQFADLVGQLGRVGLDHEHHDGGWRRIVIEKPFGHDLESAKRLNREVGKVFRESQVYRIDHYLGKETVRNLLVFRFGNGIFEPLWNRRYVDHVQITVAESIGIEARGAFYEQTGAARDVLQNHLLQLVSLVAMEPPATFEANALRDEKVKVLRAITRSPGASVKDVVRGQYGPGWVAATKVEGYREEPEVDPESETETFVAARLTIDDWRWSGVPFYVRTGKRLPEARDRDRHPVPGGPSPPVPRRRCRAGCEPAGHPDPAGRGDHAPVRGQGPRSRAGRPLRDDGLHLRLRVQRGLAGRVRDAHPRRPPGRRVAVHARRRGRGGVGHRRSRSSTSGRKSPPRTSRTTTPGRGDPRRPRSCWPGTAGAGAGSRDRAHGRGGTSPDRHPAPALDGPREQHRRDRDRAGAGVVQPGSGSPRGRRHGPPHRRPDQRDEPGRRRPAAGAGRALRGDDALADRASPVADDRHPVRGPRRPVLAGRAHRGPLRRATRRTPPRPAPRPSTSPAAAKPGGTCPRSRRR